MHKLMCMKVINMILNEQVVEQTQISKPIYLNVINKTM